MNNTYGTSQCLDKMLASTVTMMYPVSLYCFVQPQFKTNNRMALYRDVEIENKNVSTSVSGPFGLTGCYYREECVPIYLSRACRSLACFSFLVI